MSATTARPVFGHRHAGSSSRPGRTAVVAATLMLLVGVLSLASGPGAGAVTTAGRSTPACGLGLDAPDAAATIGHSFFVANSLGNSVTEVNGRTGACIAVFSGPTYGFSDPTAVVAVKHELIVANSDGTSSSLTEFTPGTTTATVLHGSGYALDDPVALAVSGTDLFVLDADAVVSEVDTTTGAAVTTFSGSKFAFDDPTSIAAASGKVFVVNAGDNSVTAITPATDSVSIISGSAFQFDFAVPDGLPVAPAAATYSGVLWVTSPATSTATEVSVATLGLLQVITNGNLAMPGPIVVGSKYVFTASPPSSSPMVSQIVRKTSTATWMMCNTNADYYFNDPQSLTVVGTSLWVVNEGGVSGVNGNVASLTEMNITTGALIQVVS